MEQKIELLFFFKRPGFKECLRTRQTFKTRKKVSRNI